MSIESEVTLSPEGKKVIKRHLEGCQAVRDGKVHVFMIDLPDDRCIVVHGGNVHDIMQTLHERTADDYPELVEP